MLTFKRVTGFLTLAALGLLGNLDTALAQHLVATPSTVHFNVQTGGFNDLFIAVQASPQATNATFSGAYMIAGMDFPSGQPL